MGKPHWIDRVTAPIAPIWTLRRQRARAAASLVQRHYEAAAAGRRTQGWNRGGGDANAAIGPGLARLREVARDLVRNNPYAESAVSTICDHTVGWGIVAKPKTANRDAAKRWAEWADTTACDADGRHNFYGLQTLVMRTVVESGECLVRRRLRRPEDGLPLPMQLQVLEPDFLDTSRDVADTGGGGRIVHGVQFDGIGRRVGYWLFPEHPGNSLGRLGPSVLVPASSVLHIFKGTRPGQVRGPSWFAPVLLRFKDFDEFEDATLMKQKIAACLAVITSDVDGTAPPLGTVADPLSPEVDSLEPGMIMNVSPGRDVHVVEPPSTRDYRDYCTVTLQGIATGLGVPYENLTSDYTDLPYSAARISRQEHWAHVYDWRWNLLVPQFCDPAWGWAMEIAQIMGLKEIPAARWTAPPIPMLDPDKEGLAYQRNIRSGIMTLSEAIKERGYDPDELLRELAADFKKLDELGLVLDSDPRKLTQAGQMQSVPGAAPAETVVEDDEEESRRLRPVRRR